MAKDIHREPFDDGTLLKLGIFHVRTTLMSQAFPKCGPPFLRTDQLSTLLPRQLEATSTLESNKCGLLPGLISP